MPAVDKRIVEVPFGVKLPPAEVETAVPPGGKLEPVAVGYTVIDPLVKV